MTHEVFIRDLSVEPRLHPCGVRPPEQLRQRALCYVRWRKCPSNSPRDLAIPIRCRPASAYASKHNNYWTESVGDNARGQCS
jgi:hypothetical protein